MNKRTMMVRLAGALMVCAASGVATVATAQGYPERPVRVVVPFEPGGGTDIAGRQIAARLGADLKQQFIVENRGGAGGLIGIENVAKSAPDGHTLLVSSASYSATLAMHKSGSETINNLIAVAQLGYSPFVLLVPPNSPYRNVGELIAAAREKPNTVNYASAGVGSGTHLALALLSDMAKAPMVHVPYKGAAPSITDLIIGRVDLTLAAHSTVAGNLNAGKLRAIGVTNAKRAPALPNVPAIGETVPGYRVELWFGVLVPRGTPAQAVSVLNAGINRMAREPDSRKALEAIGIIAESGTAEEFGTLLRSEYERWVKVIRDSKIQAE